MSMLTGKSGVRCSLEFLSVETLLGANAWLTELKLGLGSVAVRRISLPNIAHIASWRVKDRLAASAESLLAAGAERIGLTARATGSAPDGVGSNSLATGGSAMPCGLVLLAA